MVMCLFIFCIWEMILIFCFCICNCLRVFIIVCKLLVLSELKFLLMKSDFIFRLLFERDDKLRVNVREIRKDFLLERE